MDNNIEQLKKEVDNIKNSLNELKNNVSLSETEKKNQAENIKSQAETTKQRIQAEIDVLAAKTDEESKKKVEEAKTLLNSLSDTTSLSISILNSWNTETLITTTTATSTVKTEKKWFWWKTWEWLWEQLEKVKENPWKYILWATGILAAWWAIKKVWNRAFGDKKQKEWWESSGDSSGSSKQWEKKWFWDRWYGKALKWTGIWVWAGTIWYWIGKKLGLIHSDEVTDKAEDQAESTVQLREKDPEKFEKYKWMWENIDSQYNQVMKKEIDAWWWGMSIADGYEKYADRKKIDKDMFQATVPMCIDNQFSDVSNFLSEWWYYAYLRGLKFNELKNEIIWWWKEKIGKILGPYLTWLTSFIPFVWKDRSEAITNWFESWDAAEREAEIQLFFRQYAKVLNYTQDKLFSLKEKIAEEKFRNTEWNHSTASDALKDEEWVENYIHTDPRYKNFINGKLHQAIDVMKGNGIFNDTLSHDMEKIKSASDAERDTILKFKDWKDAIQRLEFAWDNLTAENYKEWVECCDKITKDIEDDFDKSRSYLYFWFTHEAFNSKTNNIQEFMKHSWLAEMKSGLKVSLWEFKQKFANWNITKEEILLYKNQVNSYFAMKKEILIGARAIQQMKSDNPNFVERVLNIWSAVARDLLNHTGASLKHLKNWEFLSAWVSATIPLYLWWKILSLAAWTRYPAAKRAWDFIKNSNIIAVARRSKWAVMRRIYAENLNKSPVRLLKARYNIAHGDQLLLQDLIEWKISWDNATKIIEKWNDSWLKIRGDKKAASISDFIQKMFWKSDTALPAKYIDILFNNKADIVFMRNPNLRKMIFWEPSISWVENVKVIWNWYRKKIYKLSDFSKVEALEDFMLSKWWNSSIFETLSKEQQAFAKQMLETGKFKTIEEVKSFTHNVKKYDLTWFDDVKITHLVEELIDHTDEFSDTAKIEERIKNAKNITEWQVDNTIKPAQELIDNPHYKKLQSDIDSEISSLEMAKKWEAEWSAKFNQIDEQIKKLKEFKNNVNRASVQEVESLEWIYETLVKVNKWKGFFDNVDSIAKLVSEDSDILHKALNELNWDELKRVIKQLQTENKLTDISDEAITSLTKFLSEIKAKNILKSWDTLVPILKNFIKLMWKLT